MDDLRNDGTAVSAEPLAFFRNHRHQLSGIAHATVTFPAARDSAFSLVLRDQNGRRMMLSGCAAGSRESSQQDAMQVLVEAGFAAEIANAVLTHSLVRLARSRDGRTWLEQAMLPCSTPPAGTFGRLRQNEPTCQGVAR